MLVRDWEIHTHTEMEILKIEDDLLLDGKKDRMKKRAKLWRKRKHQRCCSMNKHSEQQNSTNRKIRTSLGKLIPLEVVFGLSHKFLKQWDINSLMLVCYSEKAQKECSNDHSYGYGSNLWHWFFSLRNKGGVMWCVARSDRPQAHCWKPPQSCWR